MSWNIASENGQDLCEGIQLEIEARKTAQRAANELGASVYLYEVGGGDGESEVDSEEIRARVSGVGSDSERGVAGAGRWLVGASHEAFGLEGVRSYTGSERGARSVARGIARRGGHGWRPYVSEADLTEDA